MRRFPLDSSNFITIDSANSISGASTPAGLTYVLPKMHDLLLRAQYDFNRLTADEFDNEFFSDHATHSALNRRSESDARNRLGSA